jgi:hypothetical protein
MVVDRSQVRSHLIVAVHRRQVRSHLIVAVHRSQVRIIVNKSKFVSLLLACLSVCMCGGGKNA